MTPKIAMIMKTIMMIARRVDDESLEGDSCVSFEIPLSTILPFGDPLFPEFPLLEVLPFDSVPLLGSGSVILFIGS